MKSYYEIIKCYYGDEVSHRSGVRLIEHVDQGLEILRDLWAEQYTMGAYCLHPIFQSDLDIVKNMHYADDMNPRTMLLVMEYRKTANAYLCNDSTDDFFKTDLPTTPIKEVYQMLYADKKQNQMNFLLHNKGRHDRSEQLERYFENWISHLEEKLELN